MHTSEWSRHWRDIEYVRDQCADPDSCIGGDATVGDALRYVQSHEPALWDALASAMAKTFSERGERKAGDVAGAVEIALDHYFEAMAKEQRDE